MLLKPLRAAFFAAGLCLIAWAMLRAWLRLRVEEATVEGVEYARSFLSLLFTLDSPGISGAFYLGVLLTVAAAWFMANRDS